MRGRPRALSRLARRRAQAGVTLIELLVAMSMLGVIMGAAYTSVMSFQHQEVVTTQAFSAESEAQLIMDELTKDLRTAVPLSPTSSPFVTTAPDQVTFYANLGDPNGPTELDVYLVPQGGGASIIHEDATYADAGSAPSWTYTGKPKVRIVGQYVDDTAAIFTYYDSAGSVLTAPINGRDVESVGVLLTTRVTRGGPPTTLQTTIHLRNVDYNPISGS
ncbi:MAG: PulJ/GspJ family protein [Acidimicrobiales bacterium]